MPTLVAVTTRRKPRATKLAAPSAPPVDEPAPAKRGRKARDGATGRRVTLRLSETETQWCDARAAERKTTVSDAIVSLIREAMPR